jgi:tRNA (mo5U34)-methyltransferase
MEIDVLDLSPENVGQCDIVLFLGVLYHMKHPLMALENVFSVTKEQLILETQVDMLFCKRPAMAFYPGVELNNDPTNWIGPNPSAVAGMLKTVGFRRVEVFSHFHSLPYMIGIAASHKIKNNRPFFETIQQNRMVFHAWR